MTFTKNAPAGNFLQVQQPGSAISATRALLMENRQGHLLATPVTAGNGYRERATRVAVARSLQVFKPKTLRTIPGRKTGLYWSTLSLQAVPRMWHRTLETTIVPPPSVDRQSAIQITHSYSIKARELIE